MKKGTCTTKTSNKTTKNKKNKMKKAGTSDMKTISATVRGG